MRVRDVMDSRPQSVNVLSTRAEVVEALVRAPVPAIPVLKKGARKLMGVASPQGILDRLHEDRVILVMNPNAPFTYPEAPLDEAAALFGQYGVRLLPVLNASNDLLGVLRPAHVLGALRPRHDRLAAALTRRVVPAHRGTPLRVAVELLRVTRAPAIPILHDDATLAGLLDARAVLAQAIRPDAAAALMRPVTEFMEAQPPILSTSAEVADAAALFAGERHAQAVLLDEERHVVDVVSDVDVLARTMLRPQPTGLM